MQCFFRLSHQGNSLYRGYIWSEFRMITQEPALPRFGKKHSRERAQQRKRPWDRNTHDILRNRKRIHVIRVWWVSGRYVQDGGKEPDHTSRSCPSVLWSAPAHAPWHLWPDLSMLSFCHFTYIVFYYLFTYKYCLLKQVLSSLTARLSALIYRYYGAFRISVCMFVYACEDVLCKQYKLVV